MMWAEKFLGWQGRNPDPEISCWDFVAHVMEHQFAIILPRYKADDHKDTRRIIERERMNQHWRKVVLPQEGDLALFNVRGGGYHIGVMANALFMLHHRNPQSGAVIEQVNGLLFRNMLEGFYRHASR